LIACFRQHWPGGAELTEKDVIRLIGEQADKGFLVTGIRKWCMRKRRRSAHELLEDEKWMCPWNCGRYFRSTSTKSIQRHATDCHIRVTGAGIDSVIPTIPTEAQRTGRRYDGGQCDDAGGCTDANYHIPVAQIETSITSPSFCTSASAPDFNPRSILSSAATANHLYPESSSASTPATISRQTKDVTAQLQTLICDIYRRCGTNHPVFSSALLTPDLVSRLLNEQVENNEMVAGDAASPTRSKKTTAARPKNVNADLSEHAVSGSISGLFQSSWTCKCGESFKITSSRTMQKHRALCALYKK